MANVNGRVRSAVKALTPPLLYGAARRVLARRPTPVPPHLRVAVPPAAAPDFRADHVFSHFVEMHEGPVRFLQVGAFDGVSNDPIRRYVLKHGWTGILVEPIPEHFERLVANYGGQPGLTFKNAAVDRRPGSRPIYSLAPEAREAIAVSDQFSTFDRDVLLRRKGRFPQIESWIRERTVPCLTIDDLLGEAGFDRLDVIQIDTEGYDYEVLKSIDLARLMPWIVRYEHIHLSDEDRQGSIDLLAGAGYRLLVERMDVTAYRTPS
jgi:FkbM family methyltransferase